MARPLRPGSNRPIEPSAHFTYASFDFASGGPAAIDYRRASAATRPDWRERSGEVAPQRQVTMAVFTVTLPALIRMVSAPVGGWVFDVRSAYALYVIGVIGSAVGWLIMKVMVKGSAGGGVSESHAPDFAWHDCQMLMKLLSPNYTISSSASINSSNSSSNRCSSKFLSISSISFWVLGSSWSIITKAVVGSRESEIRPGRSPHIHPSSVGTYF